jgi:hypothetical protein
MIRYLTESDVKQPLTMTDAVALVEAALKARADIVESTAWEYRTCMSPTKWSSSRVVGGSESICRSARNAHTIVS